jgi:N-methylhydantoinase B/oxoprolinase/acetone carboxylase alpha subunit
MSTDQQQAPPPRADALELELFRYSVMSICEEIEINITRTAYSYLIRETGRTGRSWRT